MRRFDNEFTINPNVLEKNILNLFFPPDKKRIKKKIFGSQWMLLHNKREAVFRFYSVFEQEKKIKI